MQATLTVVLTPDELQAGAIAQARAAAQSSVGNAPTVSAAIAAATCKTDIQATAASTFTFALPLASSPAALEPTPPPQSGAMPVPSGPPTA